MPPESLNDVRNADEDSILEIADHLPEEAAEALLKFAVGETPKPVQPEVVPDPFEHPDAQRRFRVIDDVAELEHALEYPAEKWAVFPPSGAASNRRSDLRSAFDKATFQSPVSVFRPLRPRLTLSPEFGD